MKLKRVLFLTLVTFLGFCLSSCDKDNSNSISIKSDKSDVIEKNMISIYGNTLEEYYPISKVFSKSDLKLYAKFSDDSIETLNRSQIEYDFSDILNEEGQYYIHVSYLNYQCDILVNLLSDSDYQMTKYIDSLLNDTKSYIPAWNKENAKNRWNYIDGVFLNAIIKLYEKTNNLKYKDFFLKYINYYINSEGVFINPETKQYSFNEDELDSICESRILFDAYNLTNDSRYLKAINFSYDSLMSQNKIEGSSDNFWHKSSYPNQIWLDGLYMYTPFLARYASLNQREDLFKMIKNGYQYVRSHMYDEEKKLYYHGYDDTKSIFWATSKGTSKSFWLRSIGWYLASLTDSISYFPEGENKEYLKGLLKEGLDGILEYKDKDSNMFYQLVDQKDKSFFVGVNYLQFLNKSLGEPNSQGNCTKGATISNYLETSGSALISYTLMNASNNHFIDSSYYDIGYEIYEGIKKHSLKEENGTLILDNICITAGLGPLNKPYRDGTSEYYLAEKVGSNDAKGVGPLILAYIETKK